MSDQPIENRSVADVTLERPDKATTTAASDQGSLWIEVAAVMALAWLPSMFNAIAARVWFADEAPGHFRYDMMGLIVQCLQVGGPVVFIMWRSRTPLEKFGLIRPQWKDAGLALVVLLTTVVIWLVVWQAASVFIPVERVDAASVDQLFPMPVDGSDYVFLVAGCLAVGVTEELAMRAYLITRLEQLLGSTSKSIVIAAIVFASYHTYQPAEGIFNALMLGLFFGVIFVAMRRIWPLMLAHASIDVLSYVSY